MSRHIITLEGETEELQPERLYCVTDQSGMNETYVWSPDGEGAFWYGSYEECDREHGPLGPVVFIQEITDF